MNLKSKTFELFLLSFASLFLELLLVRWLSSDFRSLCVFKTFPLATCFVGLGAGAALAQNKTVAGKLFDQFPFALYLCAVITRVLAVWGFSELYFPSANLYQWTDLMLTMGSQFAVYQLIYMAFLAVLLAPTFFVCLALGAQIGNLFNDTPALKAYCINVGGALAGSIVFTAGAFACLPCWALFCVPAAIGALYLRQSTKWVRSRSILLLVLSVVAVGWPLRGPAGMQTIWSPYARIDVYPVVEEKANEKQEIGILINVNHIFHQFFFPEHKVDPGWQVTIAIRERINNRLGYYAYPYTFKPSPQDLLILGSGTGQDVREAVKNGARSIDAVEIDPLIIKLGKEYNPSYSDHRVNLVCDDARHFVTHCARKYDMVMMACLDSSALSGMPSSVRIDSFVHTKESVAAMAKLLKPDGLLVMSFGAGGANWLRDRVARTMTAALGYPPQVFQGQEFFFVAGEPVRNGKLVVKPSAQFPRVAPELSSTDRILTDDWPFMYMAANKIDVPFLLVMVEVILLSLFAGRKLFAAPEEKYWTMFCLGTAFLLVELGAITRLSLLYSATWLTSSVVINGILVMILAANVLVMKYGNVFAAHLNRCFFLLLVSLCLSFFIPETLVLSLNRSFDYAGHALLTFITLLPCFFAALVFATLFSRVTQVSRALAFNLFGCVAGALLEYLSNQIGIRNLVLFSLSIYGAAWWLSARERTQQS
jgi:SAM-dependent methyltransferase